MAEQIKNIVKMEIVVYNKKLPYGKSRTERE